MSKSGPVGHFITDGVDYHHYRHGQFARLLQPVDFLDSKGHTHRAHPELFSDGRSGKIGYYLIGSPFRSKYIEAWTMHDWYCAKAKLLEPGLRRLVRDAADLQLRNETLPALGANYVLRAVAYRFVRGHAAIHRNDPIAHWYDDFASEEASHLGGGRIWNKRHKNGE